MSRRRVTSTVVGEARKPVASETKVVTFLEMTSPHELRPARVVPGLRLVAVADPVVEMPTIRALHDDIARPHGWSSLDWDEEQWRRWLADPALHHWYVEVAGERIGWACLRSRDGEVEINSFGLRPDALGRGYGGAALSALTEVAWQLHAGGGGQPAVAVRRVWLHTSSKDHPHAQLNYRARGFRTQRIEPTELPATGEP